MKNKKPIIYRRILRKVFPAASAVKNLLIVFLLVLLFGGNAFSQDHSGHGSPKPATEPKQQQSGQQAKQEAPPTVTISPDKLQLIGVRTAVASYRPVGRTIRTVGKVEPDERKLAFVNTKIGGWVKKLFVNFTGEHVTKGQPLLSIYSPDLVTAQEEYVLALRSLKSGQTTTSGFAEIDSSRRELLESAKRRLLLWDITEQQIAELEASGKPRTDMTIEAPLSGIVLEKMVLEGAYISPGMNLYRIADLSHVWILADVYEYEVPFVKTGQTAHVTLPYASGQHVRAAVSYIYPVLDPNTRTVKVRLGMENPGLMLKPEMFANVEIQIRGGSRLTVPRDAVLNSGLRQIVYVEKKPGTYEMREVTLGQRGEEYIEVVKGLRKGERVVTSGNFLIDSESQLRGGAGGGGHSH
jgi:Cu(I)/Ag(I) efflux system membrane fusion protein